MHYSDRTRRENENTLLITVDSGTGNSTDSKQTPESWDHISFTTRSELEGFMNDNTIELLQILSNSKPGSVRECARLADRGAKNVHEDLVELEEQGVVQMEQRKLDEKPIFRYDRVVVDIYLSNF